MRETRRIQASGRATLRPSGEGMTDMNDATRSDDFGRGQTTWILLAVGVLAAVGLALSVANYVDLEGLPENADLNRSVAKALAGNSELRSKLADSEEMGQMRREEVRRLVAEDPQVQAAIVDQVLASSALSSRLEQASSGAVRTFARGDAFRELVTDAVAAADKRTPADTSAVSDLQRSLARYERELVALAAEVRDDESAAAINDMQGKLAQLQRDIAGLSDDVACAVALSGNAPRTFVLKTNESTVLPGLDLVISLARLRGDVIESVTVTAPAGVVRQVNTKVIADVRLGKPFIIEQEDTTYQGTFTFAQNRFLARAFVGFELRILAAGGESCVPGGREVAVRTR